MNCADLKRVGSDDSVQPLVSICIPTYNAEKTILETLRSVLNQSYSNLEVWIVDNDSQDNTLALIDKYCKDDRIKIFKQNKNIGAEANFESCMHLANGEYTAIFHADDVYDHAIVEKEVSVLQRNAKIGAVFTLAWKINTSGRRIGCLNVPEEISKLPNELLILDNLSLIKLILRHYNFLICPSAMVKTKIYQNEIKIWDGKNFGTSADLHVWLSIAKNHQVAILQDRLISYRISETHGTHLYQSHRIREADFFLVMRYWLNYELVQDQLTKEDGEWFEEQVRRDKIKCAFRALMRLDFSQAEALINKIEKRTFSHAMSFTYRSMTFLCAELVVRYASSGILKHMMRFIVANLPNRLRQC